MERNTAQPGASQPPLRAMVEIVGGEITVFPLCDNDVDERRILDALRFVREEAAGR